MFFSTPAMYKYPEMLKPRSTGIELLCGLMNINTGRTTVVIGAFNWWEPNVYGLYRSRELLVLTQQRQRIVNKNRVANFKNTRIIDITNSK